MRLLTLVTDAFGGRGGIAQHNRHLLTALCAYPGVEEVVALPRVLSESVGALPERLHYGAHAAGSKGRYLLHAARLAFSQPPFDAVLCGHINLLPLAYLLARLHRAPLLLVVHGIDVWQPTKSPLVKRLVRKLDAFVAVSDFTRQRFLAWNGLAPEQGFVIPDCIDLAAYGPGPKQPELLARYGLEGKQVMLTVARMSASERYKGHDEVLDLMPDLLLEIPDLAYLIVGDGDDRPRLEAKTRSLGLQDRVVFAGYVPEAEKHDHYRLADVFIMPGRGEGFGIVYLEALACGLPVVASTADASREAVRHGALGHLAHPDDPASIKAALNAALADTRRDVPDGLAYFSFDRFQERWHRCLDQMLHVPAAPSSNHPTPSRSPPGPRAATRHRRLTK